MNFVVIKIGNIYPGEQVIAGLFRNRPEAKDFITERKIEILDGPDVDDSEYPFDPNPKFLIMTVRQAQRSCPELLKLLDGGFYYK